MPDITGLITVAQLQEWLGNPNYTIDSQATVVVAAVNQIPVRYDVLVKTDPDTGERYLSDDVILGLLVQAGRWLRRKSSPLGIDQALDGSAVYTPRFDSDIEMMLGIGTWQKAVIA